MPHSRRELGELFDRALDVPESERAAWLRDACADDHALREELERLLRADAKATTFLERTPALTLATLEEPTDQLTRFGPWRVVRQLGAGGMGQVWLGERDDGAFEQRAAIKQLSYPTPGLLQRFRQERQILANLQHPSIARLIDGGLDEHGVPYLAMEFVDGVPIIDFARDHALDLRARLRMFVRVCAAVAYAHQNLVVHRDLKPSNIFVTADGEPKLLDFGIAKVLATTDVAAQTQTAARLLTPEYAAPEQFGNASTTTAVDVYALGVVLHELLCGVRPVREMTTGEIAAPSISARDPEYRRRLRGDLDRILLTALATNPERRYPSVEALSSDIRRYLDGQPISIRRDSTWYRTMKFVRRNRLGVAAALGIVLVSIVAATISLRQAAIAREQARRADAVRHFMGAVFAQSNPDENKGKPIEAHRLLEEGERQLDRMRDAEPAVRSDIAVLLVQLYRDLGDRESAVSLLHRTIDVDSTQLPDDARARALLASAAVAIEDRDAFDEGLPRAQTALHLLEQTSNPDWNDRAEADRLIALALVYRYEPTQALAHLRSHLALDEAHVGGVEAVANAHVTEGVALSALARFDEAATEFDTGVEMLRRLYGNDSDRVASALAEMAQMLFAKGDLAAAEKWQREVLRIHAATLVLGHPNIFSARHNLLGTIEARGHFADALPQRLALLDESLREKNVSSLTSVNQYDAVGIDYRELGRFDESESATRHGLALMETAQGPRSGRSIGLLRHLALTLSLQGRFADAETMLRETLVIAVAHDARTSLRACGLRRDIGRTLLLQRRYAEAVTQLAELTTDACMIGLVASDSWRPTALADLSLAQLGAGDTTAAYETAQQAMQFLSAVPVRNYNQSLTLLAFGCASLAAGKQTESETALRDALALASPPFVNTDPRVIEIKTALVKAVKLRDANAAAGIQQEIVRDSAGMPEKYRDALNIRTLAVRDRPSQCP